MSDMTILWYDASEETDDIEAYDEDMFKCMGHTDKNTWRGYHKVYSKHLSHLKYDEMNILEVGTEFGHGAIFLSEYFVNSKIDTIDIYPRANEKIKEYSRIKYFMHDSNRDASSILLNRKYNLIIDDGNHNPHSQYLTLKNLYNRVYNNGIYIIEDIKIDRISYDDYSIMLFKLIEEFKSNGIIKKYFIYRHDNIVWKEVSKAKDPLHLREIFLKFGISKGFNECKMIFDDYTGFYDNFICVIEFN